MQLTRFNEIDFLPALKEFFGKSNLNVPINYVDDKPVSAKKILQNTYKDNEAFRLINDVYFVGLVDDAAFRGNQSLAIDNIKSDYDGILIFGVTLNNRDHGQLPTRFLGRASLSHLAEISRAFNREFYYTPVVVVFKYNDANSEYLAFANTERLKYKDNREGEKAGKVTLLRDIDIRQPHSGHQRILAELAIPKTGNDRVDSFASLYAYWQKVLDVSLLNKNFYRELSTWYFWAVGRVTFPSEPNLLEAQAKKVSLEDLKQEHKSKNVIRLLTRLLFVWFIKEKGLIPLELFEFDDLQKDILKNIPLYTEQVNQGSIYYKAILQNLFFATLNCPIKPMESHDSRVRGFRKNEYYGQNRDANFLMRYEKYFQNPEQFVEMVNSVVPFLNGGLFECLDDKTNNIFIDGFSDNLPKNEQLIVPDYLFFGVDEKVALSAEYGVNNKGTKEAAEKGLINILKAYKFTITENTPIEEDVALDPELLGKVFENLLASYNPETEKTARKQTGSFYTPREIVNYMVDESLIAYLKNELLAQEPGYKEEDLDQQLRQLVSFDAIDPFEENAEVQKWIIKALDKCTILDPACGSGAFPMGILQKMVHILQKLDSKNKVWKEVQSEKARQESADVFEMEDKEARKERLLEINEAFDESLNYPDYARKLFLIENCIYGVDIQSIATQISKLRFFISLMVDQKVDPSKDNFGIRPLPNLETKFVAANTLIGIEKSAQTSLFDTPEIKKLEADLKKVRHRLFSSKSPSHKRKLREQDKALREKIVVVLQSNGLPADTANKLAHWDPYNQNISSPFFDSEWMFDISDGFDIVIGNPPYVRIQDIQNSYPDLAVYLKKHYIAASGSFDLYCCFIEKAISLKKTKGSIAYIVPHKFFQGAFGKQLRGLIAKEKMLNQIVDFGSSQVFDSATTYTCLLFLSSGNESFKFSELQPLAQQLDLSNILDLVGKENNIETELVKIGTIFNKKVSEKEWNFAIGGKSEILAKLRSQPRTLADICSKIFVGLQTSADKIYFLEHISEENGIITAHSKSLNREVKIEKNFVKPLLKGADVHRYQTLNPKIWCVFPYKLQNNKATLYTQSEIKNLFPMAWQYLLANQTDLEGRESGKMKNDQFYAYIYPKSLTEFEKEKIVTPDIASGCQMTLDYHGYYHTTTIYSFVFKQDTKESLKYYLALLNSQVLWYFLTATGSVLRGDYFRFKTNYLMPFPIPTATEAEQKAIETLVGYVLYLTNTFKDIPSHPTTLDQSVTDKRMNRYFEEIIDALVMELYLPEELHTYDKYFMRYVLSENLPTLETIQGDKTEKMRQIFGKLFDKEHPIRHNLFLLNTIPVVRIIEGKS